MIQLNVNNETNKLRAVVLGTAQSNGLVPNIEDCYDQKVYSMCLQEPTQKKRT